MRSGITPATLSVTIGLVLLWHAGESSAQARNTEVRLATDSPGVFLSEGLHRVHPSLMEAAWVRADLDIASYRSIFLVPTGVQYRELPERTYTMRTRDNVEFFPIPEVRREFIRGTWQSMVSQQMAIQQSYELQSGIGTDVLIVQGLLVDMVSRIPPSAPGSDYTVVRDPWAASVVLEMRDGTTGQLLARTIDRRTGTGLMEQNSGVAQIPDLLQRWAEVLLERLEQISDVGGRSDLAGRATTLQEEQ